MKLPFDAQNPPASDEDIENLEEVMGGSVPPVYALLLRYSNGGEWPIDVEPFTFVMFDVDTIINNLTGTDFTDAFPGFMPIGGDGMSEYIALDLNGEDEASPRVVAIDALEEEAEAAIYPVADTIEAFAAHIGKQAE